MVNQRVIGEALVLTGFATPTETARFLRLSKAMVHKLIGEGKVPACRYGRAVRIPWSWLRAQAANKDAANGPHANPERS
jgi:excisionase family DNA binding protein